MNSIVLTGINRGLGKSIAELLISCPLISQRIFIGRQSINTDNLGFEYIQADLGSLNEYPLDISFSQATRSVVFVNNAGTIEPIGKASQIPVHDLDMSIRVNCIGPLALAQQLTLETGKIGAKLFILNLSTGAAHRPIKGWLPYCVSKAAAVMAFDVLSAENDHVEVEHFDPGIMDTDMQRRIREQSSDLMPDVELFKSFKEERLLNSPNKVAIDVFAKIQRMLR